MKHATLMQFRANSGDAIPIFSLPFPWSAGAAGHEASRQLLFESRQESP
jgi:hypothetical protein